MGYVCLQWLVYFTPTFINAFSISRSVHRHAHVQQYSSQLVRTLPPPYIYVVRGRNHTSWWLTAPAMSAGSFCKNVGLGNTFDYTHLVFDLVERSGAAYVCDPGHFCAGHEEVCVGDWFGCYNSSYAIGRAVAFDTVNKTRNELTTVMVHVNRSLFDSTGVSTDVALDDKSGMYVVGFPKRQNFRSDNYDERWGLGYRWVRHQFHLVRDMDPARAVSLCWQGAPPSRAAQQRRVAVHVRRGDRARCHVSQFVTVLDQLFRGEMPIPEEFRMNESGAHLVIISETESDDPEFGAFKKYSSATVTFQLAPAVLGQGSKLRLRNDLDCLSTADVAIVCGGGFSRLVGALTTDSGYALILQDHQDLSGFSSDPLDQSTNKYVAHGRADGTNTLYGKTDIPNVKEVHFW